MEKMARSIYLGRAGEAPDLVCWVMSCTSQPSCHLNADIFWPSVWKVREHGEGGGVELLRESRAFCLPPSAPHVFFTGSSGSSITFVPLFSERHEVKVMLGS